MYALTFAFTLVLAASSSMAAPLSSDSHLHFWGKRDAVCGLNFRSLVNKESCVPNKAAFTLTAPSTINKVDVATANDVPDNVQCDHAIEIQLLDSVAQSSGLCKVLTELAATGASKATLLGPLSTHISELANLNFLDAQVNNQKKTVVQRSLKGTAQGSSPLDKAVGNYLGLVKTGTLAVASTLDQDISTIMASARTALAGITVPPNATSRNKIKVQHDNLDAAIKAFDATKTVTQAWTKVLTDAPHS